MNERDSIGWTGFNNAFAHRRACCEDVKLVCELATEYGMPIECQRCYKALLFWEDEDDALSGQYFPHSETARKFKKLLKDIPTVGGKYDDEVAVFYFIEKGAMLVFIDVLRDLVKQYRIAGRVRWRISGAYIQRSAQHLFICTTKLASCNSHYTFQELLDIRDGKKEMINEARN